MMKSGRYYEIKLNKRFDFLTANTDFYRFLGKRLYSRLDDIMPEEDVSGIRNIIFEKETNTFFSMRLYDEVGNIVDMISYVKEVSGEDTRTIVCMELSDMWKEQSKLREDVCNYAIFLSQFDCVYFVYEKKTDTIEMFKISPEYCPVCEKKLSEYEEQYGSLDEKVRKTYEDCLIALRTGKRGFNLPVSEDFAANAVSGGNIRISGIALYDNGEHTKTLGNISTLDNDIFYKVVNKDQLTGLMLKEDATAYAKNRIDVEKKPTTIAIIDVDDFKNVNDNYGHMKGDEALRKCASIIESELGRYGKAGRIGGDEFFIIIEHDNEDNTIDDEGIRTILRSIKNDIFSIYTDEKDGFHISSSIGAATFPNDTDNFEDLFLVADFLLYRAKNKGKNRYIKYDPLKHDSVYDIVKERKGSESVGIEIRKGIPKCETVCKIIDDVYCNRYGLKTMFDNVAACFGIERIVVYCLDDKEMLYQCGRNIGDEKLYDGALEWLDDISMSEYYKDGIIVINNTRRFENSEFIYNELQKQGIVSFMQHRVVGADQKTYIISYEAHSGIVVWNTEDFYLYRILDRAFERMLRKDGFE